jgi:hypothetical protein
MSGKMSNNLDKIQALDDQGKRNKLQHWYRGEHCNLYPDKLLLMEPGGIEKWILPGWLPDKPFITKDKLITTFGSCFASYIKGYLRNNGWRVEIEGCPRSIVEKNAAGLVNTFTVRQQFEWAWEDRKFLDDIWFETPDVACNMAIRRKDDTKHHLDNTDVFIVTLGLSEVWSNKATGDVFWKAVPAARFDPAKHEFRVSTVAENTDNLEKILELIRKYRGEAPVIFTLSPVPLRATFRPVSAITATSVSKAILRVAVDELLRNHPEDNNLFYWPSYEIVMDSGIRDTAYTVDNRHVEPHVISTIMSLFSKYYLKE